MPSTAPRKTLWTDEEDDKLRQLVARHGSKNWTRIASLLPSKVGKQCRRRWQNHLNATLKTHVWTADEDRTLLEGHRVLGNKWTEIARMVTGRTDNAVKNRFMALTKKGMPEDSDLDSGDGVTLAEGRAPTDSSSSQTHKEHGSPRPTTKSRGGGGWLPSSPMKRDSSRAAKEVKAPTLGGGRKALSGLVEAVAEASTSDRQGDEELEAPPLLRSPQKRQRVGAAAAAGASAQPLSLPCALSQLAQMSQISTAAEPAPTLQEVSLLRDFATAAQPPSTQEMRGEFDELLGQAQAVYGGATFVSFTLNTAKLALASCRGAGPLMDAYMSSLAAIFQVAHLGQRMGLSGDEIAKYSAAGVPNTNTSSPPPTPPM